MITKELIEEQIRKLEIEQAALKATHEQLIREHNERAQKTQEIALSNMARMNQLGGALAQLRMFLNGSETPTTESNP